MKKIQELEKDIHKHIQFAEKTVIPKFIKYKYPTDQFDKSLVELKKLKERCSASLQSKSHICLIGNTGAGKSTLINAILKLDLLPTSNHANCTSVATEITHHENTHFDVQLDFISRTEWEQENKTIHDDYKDAILEGEHAQIKERDKKRYEIMTGESWDVLIQRAKRAQSNASSLFDGQPLPTFDQLKEEVRKAILAERVSEKFQTASEVKGYLEQKLGEKVSPLWPAVKRLVIQCPPGTIPPGIVLVDLPGIDDPNPARNEVAFRAVKRANHFWVVYSVKRPPGNALEKLIIHSGLLKKLIGDGRVRALSILGTHTDDVGTLRDARNMLGLPETCDKKTIIEKRSEAAERNARKQFGEWITETCAALTFGNGQMHSAAIKKLREDVENADVILTSATAYLDGWDEKREESELEWTKISKARILLSKIGTRDGIEGEVKRIRDELAQVRSRWRSFFLVLQGILGGQTEQLFSILHAASSTLSNNIQEAKTKIQANKIHALSRVENIVKDLNKDCGQEIAKAGDSLEVTVGHWSEIHWATLRAICKNSGRYFSQSTDRRYDLPQSMIEPLCEKITMPVETLFHYECAELTKTFVRQADEALSEFTAWVRGLLEAKEAQTEVSNFWKASTEQMKEIIRFRQANQNISLETRIKTIRHDMFGALYAQTQSSMNPIFEAAGQERGAGMKKRIVDILRSGAKTRCRGILENARDEIVRSCGELSSQIRIYLLSVAEEAERYLNHGESNAGKKLKILASELHEKQDSFIESSIETISLLEAT
jgi:hypothetical protein